MLVASGEVMTLRILLLVLTVMAVMFGYVVAVLMRNDFPADIRELMAECKAEGRTPILDRDAQGHVLAMRCPRN